MRTRLLANEEDKPFVMGVGSDAVGLEPKTHVRTVPEHDGRVKEVLDFGVHSVEDPAPYPAIGLAVAQRVSLGELDRAILICGTGIGMAISANKIVGVPRHRRLRRLFLRALDLVERLPGNPRHC